MPWRPLLARTPPYLINSQRVCQHRAVVQYMTVVYKHNKGRREMRGDTTRRHFVFHPSPQHHPEKNYTTITARDVTQKRCVSYHARVYVLTASVRGQRRAAFRDNTHTHTHLPSSIAQNTSEDSRTHSSYNARWFCWWSGCMFVLLSLSCFRAMTHFSVPFSTANS